MGKKKGETTTAQFDSLGKITPLSIPDYEEWKKTEIERVRTGLKDSGAQVVDPSVKGSIYSADPILVLDHIGGVPVTNLKEAYSKIETVGDLKACSAKKSAEIVAATSQGPFYHKISSSPCTSLELH